MKKEKVIKIIKEVLTWHEEQGHINEDQKYQIGSDMIQEIEKEDAPKP